MENNYLKSAESERKIVDIDTIHINTNKSKEERVLDFINQVKNPYCLNVEGIKVNISFKKNGRSLQEILQHYFETKLI